MKTTEIYVGSVCKVLANPISLYIYNYYNKVGLSNEINNRNQTFPSLVCFALRHNEPLPYSNNR